MAAPFYPREIGGEGGQTQYEGRRGSGVQSHLPNGGCNFRELTLGARAPVCGCKRFWLNGSALGAQERQDCFCGHHACFHHAGSQTPATSIQPAVSALQDEAARHVRGRNTPDGYYAVHNAGAAASPKPSTGLGIQADFPSQSRSINTRMWDALNGFARNQDDGTASITTSKLPSTAVPSINGDTIPPYQHRSMGPPLNIPSLSLARAGLDEYMGSATEVATPSVAGTPDLQAFIPPGYQPRFSPARLPAGQHLGRVSTPTPQHQQPEALHATNHLLSRDVENMLQSYGRRLDVLETLSFSHVPVEEVQDKFEHFDDRLLDFEQWRSERDQEREQEATDRASDDARDSGSKRRRLLPDQLSFSSSGSFDSAAAMHTEAAVLATVATNLELEPRFEALENRMMDLENSAMPSFVRPWEVQVVLLPWGSELRGIWFTSSDATQQSQRSALQSSTEWTGPKLAPKVSFQSSASTAWTTESIEAWAEDAQDWLSPKACGPAGDVFQRLASRGLVRDLTFTSSTSKHIWDTITTAFRRVLPEKPPADSDLLDQYQGLSTRFLPLRKVRKSTRLRFLNPAEMVTSASWNAELLESAMMKVNDGQRRLYITTPHAYLQNGPNKWTWKTLKDLPTRDEVGEVQSHTIGRGIAIEACWSYNDKLDYVPSLHSSFGSRTSRKSQGDSSVHQPIPDQPMSPLSDARPLRQRTISSSLPNYETATLALKRRAASFETLDNAPISSDPPGLATTKRARLSISPEAERRGVGFTPRLSREPPSPFHSDVNMVDSRSQGAASKRGTTPFAYATPHSNSTLMGMDMAGLTGGGDDDTVLGTDLADEEWQGVGDGFEDEHEDGEDEVADDESVESGDHSAYGDTDVDEEEGMTIYEF